MELNAGLKGCDVVIHCAGRAHRPVESVEEKRLFQEVNVEGTRRLVNACLQVGVPRIVYVSTSAVYQWGGDSLRKEDHVIDRMTAYAKSKYDGELIIEQSGLDWRIARLATVFGDGDRANFLKLAKGIRSRRFFVPGRGDSRKSVLPVGRAAELLCRYSLLASPLHRIVNLASPDPPTLREICDAFSMECGFAQVKSLPLQLMKAIAGVGDIIRILGLQFPLDSGTLRKLTTSTVLDTTRQAALFPELGWTSFREQLSECADYYRNSTASPNSKRI